MTQLRTPRAWAESQQRRQSNLKANAKPSLLTQRTESKPNGITIDLGGPAESPRVPKLLKPNKVKAAVDMSANTVDNLRCPVTNEPMRIVQCYFRESDGTMSPSFVAVHPQSRVVLPLPNEVLAQHMAAANLR